ncbi:hypothetical protein TWF173_006937 [Orbilia oligospora]|nr:hypothetical protein TWF173_006937 [Orbilia oligospora]
MPAPCYTPSNSQSQSHRRTSSRSQQQEPESPTLEPTYPPNISKTNNNNDDINWQDVDKILKTTGQRQRPAHIYGASGFSDLPRQSSPFKAKAIPAWRTVVQGMVLRGSLSRETAI